MKLSRRLIHAAKRRAFPWQRRVPREGGRAVRIALRFALLCRREGLTGPAIYRRYMDAYLAINEGCGAPDCFHCETGIAATQRLILGALEAIAGLEEP
jgi:hypothetical protein